MDNLIKWSDLSSPDYTLKRRTVRLGRESNRAEVSVSMTGKMWRFLDHEGKRIFSFPLLTVSRKEISIADRDDVYGTKFIYSLADIYYFDRSDSGVRKGFGVRHTIYAINRLLYNLRNNS